MNKIAETKSNWEPVTEMMDKAHPITLGRYASYWYYNTPRRMLHSLTYYKFAAKMIGSNKKVCDIGCNEGLGTWLLAKECGYCKGIDFDEEAIAVAKKNFQQPNVAFSTEDFLTSKLQQWDAIVNFDVVEHILPQNAPLFFKRMADSLAPHGIMIIGTPSQISQQFASEISKKGHVNIYSHERLEAQMRELFDIVFLFSAHDEVVHTGYLPLAHYLIAVGCKKR